MTTATDTTGTSSGGSTGGTTSTTDATTSGTTTATTTDGPSTGPEPTSSGPGSSTDATTGTSSTTATDGSTGSTSTGSTSDNTTGPNPVDLEIVVVGQTDSNDFPLTPNALQSQYKGGQMDGFVARIALPAGGPPALAYSSYYGGNQLDQIRDVALAGDGAFTVTGRSASTNLTTQAALQPNFGGGGMDAFLVQFAPDDALVFATYFGGSSYDVGYGLSVDPDGNLYVSGRTSSTNFPTTPGTFQPTYAGGQNQAPYFGGDFFITKVKPDGSGLVWGTFLGGSNDDTARGRNFVDATGAVYVDGHVASNNFPTSANAFQKTLKGATEGGVAKLSPAGDKLVYGTLLGSSDNNDAATGGIVVAANGEAVICGYVNGADFPATPGAVQGAHAGSADGFVARLSPDGSKLLAATYLGGSGYEECQGVALADNGDVVVVGLSSSDDFPTTPGALQGSSGGSADMTIARLSPNLETFIFSTYLGGGGDDGVDASRVHVDGAGGVVLVCNAGDGSAPTTPDGLQNGFGGGAHDVWVIRLAEDGSQLLFGAFLGGGGDDFARSIAVRTVGG